MKVHSSASEAVSFVGSGSKIYFHGQAATPVYLIDALLEQARAKDLKNIEILHLHTIGAAKYADPQYAQHFKTTNFFVGANMRSKLQYNNVDYLPCFLSEIPQMIRSKRRLVDTVFIQVSPPDQHGYCSLGTSVEATKAAVETASLVIAHINDQMPRTHGDGIVHVSQIHHAVYFSTPIFETSPSELSAVEKKIGEFTSALIDNGSTLQMGIGSIPDAVVQSLHSHQGLGIHTEMWSDGALDLILKGVVDNSHKKIHPGKTVSTFIMGSKKVYDFINDNPSVIQLDASYVNHPSVIARNPKVVAINSAVEIDLTGQVCADSIGGKIISGVGGQLDFITGAAMSSGGKAVIALTSRTKSGKSRIAACLQSGAGVVTTRAHVHFVVTEFGIADLYGKTISERAHELIKIAHPEDRDLLMNAYKKL